MQQRLKLWGWEKKPRTMLRFIRAGDIFCFKLNDELFCFGRVVSKVLLGHIGEIFEYISHEPRISEEDVASTNRLFDVLLLDSYSFFDKKSRGEWRIIGHQEDYLPTGLENTYFVSGQGSSASKTDVWGNKSSINDDIVISLLRLEGEIKERVPVINSGDDKYYLLTPRGDTYIKRLVEHYLSNKQ